MAKPVMENFWKKHLIKKNDKWAKLPPKNKRINSNTYTKSCT